MSLLRALARLFRRRRGWHVVTRHCYASDHAAWSEWTRHAF